MKLYTHRKTIKAKISWLINGLLILSVIGILSIFGIGAFACFYYAKSFIGGISIILFAIIMTTLTFLLVKDFEKAYIEIKENEIKVVDYFLGIKKEKKIIKTDITSSKIYVGYSHKVKGTRLTFGNTQYIVFYKDKKYLFKIIYLPETAEFFKQYIK